MSSSDQIPPRKHGLAHLFAAARYSVGGLRRLSRESAFRHEVLAFVVLLAAYLALGAGGAVILAFVILFCLLVAVEALNTAIEALVDRVSPEWSEAARDAKDLGSLAVMCLLVAHGALLVWVVWQALCGS
ncbi:diacylglycerol kinase [Sedimentimonas flavescens]|uniref:Diacylglycerol kinase n=1 Tax=Sedimentimonas flavescens TaxID=2851012 RepID=A0ABT2ZUZ2_9RHOB|nr:diacylglycerol kinase [Sedimentimonas flavescens]MCT2539152.1 diacylglycerol kinase [Sedimentimonas flavescens]MCV2877568.1 diacylglycerol kinase [Sedimentimonas flavescens]